MAKGKTAVLMTVRPLLAGAFLFALSGCVTTPETEDVCNTQMFDEWKTETGALNPGVNIMIKEIEDDSKLSAKTTIIGHYNNSPPASDLPVDETTRVVIVHAQGRIGVVLAIVQNGCVVTLQSYSLKQIYELMMTPVGVKTGEKKPGIST